MDGELTEAKKEINRHETTIKELKEGSIIGKISGILPHKKLILKNPERNKYLGIY